MRAFVRGALVVAWQKVFMSVVRDRVVQLFLFALPLGTTLIVGAASAGSTELRIAAVRPDDPAMAAALESATRDTATLRVDWVDDRADALVMLARQEVVAMLEVVPLADGSGSRPAIELRVDRGRVDPGLVSGPLLGVVSAIAARTDGPRLATEVLGVDASQIRSLVDELPTRRRPTIDAVETGPPRAIGGFQFAAVGNLVLYSFVVTFGTAVALTNERNDGQLERLLAAPVPRSALVTGHLLARIGVGLVQIAFVIAATSLLFGVRWGSLPLVAALTVPFALLAGALGLLAATTYRSNEQAVVATGLIAFPAAMLGGCFWSLAIVGTEWRIAGHVLPHAWLVDGLLEVSGGGGLSDVAVELVVLVAATIAVIPLTVWVVSRYLTTPAPRT